MIASSRLSARNRLADRRPLCAYRPDPASGRLRHLREQFQQRARPVRNARASASASKAACSTGSGTPVRDVLVEIWQANAAGRYNHPADQQEGKPLDPELPRLGPHRLAISRPASTASRPSSPAPSSAAAGAGRWRRMSTSGSSRAASISG